MKLAILGLGTVGSGVINLIQKNRDIIEQRAKDTLEITHVYSRSLNNRYGVDLTGIQQTQDINDIINSDVDTVIEVMGGIDSTYEIIKQLLQAGKHVVTANKDMLAIYVEELSRIANEHQVQFNYEASVGGGIPVILGMQYGLNANRISRIVGILNGTTNYIMTRMAEDGWSFDKALAEAQAKGYAEADPTNDVGGFDAQRKIAILTRLAYRQEVTLDDIFVKGLQSVELKDLQVAQANGYIIKLLGLTEINDGVLDIMVAPMMLPADTQLAKVNEAMNAVVVNGDAIGETLFYGPGAGSMETASAVVSDTMMIALFGFIGNTETEGKAHVQHSVVARPYYLRITGDEDQARAALGDYIELIIQSEQGETCLKTVPVSLDDFDTIMAGVEIQASYPIID